MIIFKNLTFYVGILLAIYALYPQGIKFISWDIMDVYIFFLQYAIPVLLFINLFIARYKKVISFEILYIALIYSLVVVISSIQSDEIIKGILTGIYFSLVTVNLFYIYKEDIKTSIAFNYFIFFALELWLLIPMALIIFGNDSGEFLNPEDGSFGGFSGSRIQYALWSVIAVILGSSFFRNKGLIGILLVFLIGLNFLGLYISQSRGGFIVLFIAFLYPKLRGLKTKLKDILFTGTLLFIIIALFLSWEIYGRQNSLEFMNSTRIEIYQSYLNLLNINNFFLGFGRQVSITIESGGVTQAHNLILQWLINWGALGLVLLLFFLYRVWCGLKTIEAKMLMIAFIAYSMMQPVQGTANFFGPVTFLVFMLIVGLDNNSKRY